MTDDLLRRLERCLPAAFAIERELGGGGMARVFLATESALDRQVVIKVLDLEAGAAASAERFRREIQLIAKLQHPHIVPLLTAGGDDSLLWYAMPFVAGESLRARLVREGALPLADAMRIARGMFDALSFAHDGGVIHRDVKPENVLLEGRHAVVADFGVAKALADAGLSGGLTSVGMALGTPAYMAPEQAMAEPTTNHRADLYAAGAVLYEMLAGTPPFSGSAPSVIAAHAAATVPPLVERRRDVPPQVADLVHRLMAKNPAERPQSANEALAVLESVMTPGATATSYGLPVRRPTRRSMLIAAAVLVVAGGTWAAVRFRPARILVAEGSDVIAIMPLGSTGDSTLARLGRDLVVTLSANLDGVGSIRTVDAMTVLQGAKQLAQPVRLADAMDFAKRLGAKTVIQGAVTSEAGRAHLELALYPVGGGDPIARATAIGVPDSIRSLTDSLTRQLITQIWKHGSPPSSNLSEVATSSTPALRAFLAGEAYFEKLQMDSAMMAYTAATQADSMFAQAWLRLNYTRGMVLLPVDTVARRHLRSLVDRLPRREREWVARQ
jgi:serine/threonine-protein kinase